ncbi:ABC transporter substrate-binding protein [Jiangella rhizosphaerae]|uniref:ABC transporter substrate-binding protein n=1 Tax=Jiangella rhizosphaerae TaxID=2293569 RepID=A0A418KRH4_9ACTN|nr:ABC transporter substrate-binding protein [Jiangella rhizosphaerae]
MPGFGVTVDADGEPLPARESASAEAPDPAADPRAILGPSTAIVDQTVTPVADGVTPALPVTVHSCDGETVVVEDASRILAVDLYGTLAEIVFSLGLGDHVVGRDASTGFPQAAGLPLVTPGGHDLNAEAVLGLDPTVVLTDASVGPPEVQQQLRDAGIPVIFFDDARDLDRIPGQIRAVAGALGVPEAGEQLVERTSGEIAGALALAPAGADPLRIAFLYTRGGMVQLLAGPGSGADAMIRAIGAVDVGTDIGLDRPFTQITSEALIEAAPDVIIMMTKGLESIGGVDGMLRLPGVAQTPAGEKLRVVDMADSVLLSFGPRTGRTIEALAHAVYQP